MTKRYLGYSEAHEFCLRFFGVVMNTFGDEIRRLRKLIRSPNRGLVQKRIYFRNNLNDLHRPRRYDRCRKRCRKAHFLCIIIA